MSTSINRIVNDIFYRYDFNRDGAIKHRRDYSDKNAWGKVKETFALETESRPERVFDEERTLTYDGPWGRDGLFQRADLNNDGSTTVQEMTKHIGVLFDEDGDGHLSSRNLAVRLFHKLTGGDSSAGELQNFKTLYPERVARSRDLSEDD